MSGKKSPRNSEGMDRHWGLRDIRELIDLLIDREVTEFEMEREGTRIRILRRESGVRPAPASPQPPSPAPSVDEGDASPTSLSTPAAPEAVPEEHAEHLYVQKSPIVGTFYGAPAPDAPPYVNLGDSVRAGQVLCIIEAMKLMNEIESEVAGEIVRIEAENGQPVEYGQPLFAIKPSSSK